MIDNIPPEPAYREETKRLIRDQVTAPEAH